MVTKPRFKVALFHNYYLQRGGEDASFEAEKALLIQMGHEVCSYTRRNSEIRANSPLAALKLGLRTVWARDSHSDIRALLRLEQPTVCHFNNTFPLISPSGYYACRDAGVPVIQNLRNYRLTCVNGYLFRAGRVCEDCIGHRLLWPGVAHACYRGSRIESGVVAAMIYYHNLRQTWTRTVDIYIALTEFSRRKFIQAGLPAQKIVVKPNFAYDHGLASGKGAHAVFIGRLDPPKGILGLVRAWSQCAEIPLKIIGDGPLRATIASVVRQENLSNVDLCGQLSSEDSLATLKGARFMIFPSVWYESFPRVLLESFSVGRPVIASDAGVTGELIQDGVTGHLFRSGDWQDLVAKVRRLWDHPAEANQMGRQARAEYERKYTPERNYQILADIYSSVISEYQR